MESLARLSVIAVGLLLGCSSQNALVERTSWVSAEGRTGQFESERDMCLRESAVVRSDTRTGTLGGGSVLGGIYIGGVAASVGSDHDWDVFTRCMELGGWHKQGQS